MIKESFNFKVTVMGSLVNPTIISIRNNHVLIIAA